jgi:hypothetical protein
MDAPLLPGLCPRRPASISHQPHTLLTAATRLSLNAVVLFIRDKEVESIVEEKVMGEVSHTLLRGQKGPSFC